MKRAADNKRRYAPGAVSYTHLDVYKRQELTSAVEEGLFVNGNSVQLKQLTSILIDNAIRHSERGSAVALSLRRERSHAVLSVVNAGPPIPAEAQKQIFERFYRTDSALSLIHI